MLFDGITILNENFEMLEHQYVAVENAVITYIGAQRPEGAFGRVYPGKDRLLLPGFYNAHAHSPMTLMRGYGENLALQDWLNTRIFPFEDRLDPQAVYWGTLLAMAESLRFGIVSSSDMYYFTEDMVRAVADSGAKANISRAIANPTGEPFAGLAAVREAREALTAFQGAADGRIRMDVSLHAEYTSNEETARGVAAMARETGAILHVHVSETESEHIACKERHGGRTPVQYFRDCGMLDGPMLAAHCVWCEPEDLEILRERQVTVATNPVSNLKLASGMCPSAEMLRRGIRLAIGTDSVASNNSLNFLEEIKAFATVAKVREMNPTCVTPRQALEAATVNGALAQGRTDCGALRVGSRADLIVLPLDVPNMHPVHDLLNNLVYAASGSDICLTMVDGKVLYENGAYTTIDLERTMFEAEAATQRILRQL